ncbi:hypothetical protein N9F35_01225 [Gammaproteobacteria bacterium]|nr:hypothetical protein [Gammaproteobacteria bacterium]|tara:strand:- start:379 stop:705 length:327 start_codon:yes stop_codon:yes gene_type:complete
MEKSNLMAIGLVVCMLSACGSSEDVDAVAASMMTGSNPVSEKDAKCLAKNIKKNASEDQWNKMVAKANGEIDDSETTLENMGEQMEEAMALMAPIAIASKECGVPFGQ